MLRLHFLQHWFNLSDPAAEEVLYGSLSMRQFVGIDLGREPVSDETTILNFRHLLERHDLGKLLFDRVNEHLASRPAVAVSEAPCPARRVPVGWPVSSPSTSRRCGGCRHQVPPRDTGTPSRSVYK